MIVVSMIVGGMFLVLRASDNCFSVRAPPVNRCKAMLRARRTSLACSCSESGFGVGTLMLRVSAFKTFRVVVC